MSAMDPPAPTSSGRTQIYDLIWFGFPLREGLSEETLIDFELPPGDAGEPTDIARIHAVLLETFAKLLGTDTDCVVPLSGGLDSRLVLSLLLQVTAPRNIHCYTYGFKGHLDYELAPAVAAAAGVRHVRRGFHEVDFDREEFEAYARSFDVQSAPTYNLFAHYYTQKVTQLCQQDLPDNATLWSGFLGDRLLSGMWIAPDASLDQSVERYAESYGCAAKRDLVRGRYAPAERLLSLYRGRTVPAGSSWCEYIDLQQRQYFNKKSFEAGSQRHRFPLADPRVVRAMLALPHATRARNGFYRRYALGFHRSLFRLPTTRYFGYPLRPTVVREQVDRALRLARKHLEKRLGLPRRSRPDRRYNAALVRETWPQYEGALLHGLKQTASVLRDRGFQMHIDLDQIRENRAFSQVFASLGCLL